MKISEFVLQVLNDRERSFKKMVIAKITDEEAKTIFEKTGVNLKGYTHSIDNYGVVHAMKNHSVPTEIKRGLLPIVIEDFDRIMDILKNYDELTYAGKSGVGRDVLMYKKKVNGYIFYLEEIRSPSKKEAFLQTMYLKPNKKGLNPKVKP